MSSSPIQIRSFQISELRIPFKIAFRHAAAERAETSSVWVRAITADGVVGHGESCPRPYVTGETVDSVRAFFARNELSLRRQIVDLESLRAWIAAHSGDLDASPAAWCAVELAILDALGQQSGETIERLLSVPPLDGLFRYTAVLGDARTETFAAMAEQYRRRGFADYKVKLSGEENRDREKLNIFRDWPAAPSFRIRADANNLWETADEAIAALGRLDYSFFAIEEPIRTNQYAGLARIADALQCKVILDESFLRVGQLSLLPGPAEGWLINLRVSKMGGIVRSLEVLNAARARGIGVIVGAQVGETSLLTRAGLTIARAAGDALVAQEGAFGTFLLERDVCEPVLMFGAGGVLDASTYPALKAPGLGLSCF